MTKMTEAAGEIDTTGLSYEPPSFRYSLFDRAAHFLEQHGTVWLDIIGEPGATTADERQDVEEIFYLVRRLRELHKARERIELQLLGRETKKLPIPQFTKRKKP